ncbi:MAG: lipocalin [Rhodobacter sp.]|nr:lipocalin [Rhodobacter sp.]
MRGSVSCTVRHLFAPQTTSGLPRNPAGKRCAGDPVRRVILALALVLTACVGAGRKGDADFRDAKVPIWSAAAFAPARIVGRWQQVATYQAKPEATCREGRLDFEAAPAGLAVEGVLCLNGTARKVSGLATVSGPGRLQVKGQEDWWILWVDDGYRTLAIGTPSGRFGFVLDRGVAAPDRLVAAREIFDFNGYDRAGFRAL